jgi:hypothetical protein
MATDVTPEQVLRAAAAGDGYLAIGPHAPRWITDELVARGHGTHVLGDRDAPLGFRINAAGRAAIAKSTDDTLIASGPDHYTEGCRVLHEVRTADPSAAREDIDTLLKIAQTHALFAIAAGIGGLDAVEGPGGGSATGRYSVADADRWATVTGALSDPTPVTSPPPIETCTATNDGAGMTCDRPQGHEKFHIDPLSGITWL